MFESCVTGVETILVRRNTTPVIDIDCCTCVIILIAVPRKALYNNQ
jgi:hypothetical protein